MRMKPYILRFGAIYMGLVFSDFDGTVTRYDTILPLGIAMAMDHPNPAGTLTEFLKSFLQLKLRLITNQQFKEAMAVALLAGRSVDDVLSEIDKHFEQFAGLVDVEMLHVLQEHRANGDEVYFISSNFELFIQRFADAWQMNGAIATKSEVENERFTGRLLGNSCDGLEKVLRIQERFGEERSRDAVAYGDSRGDIELLSYVREGYWIDRRFNGAARVRRVR